MKRLFGAFVKIASVLGLLILLTALVSRFADGPMVDFLPGGRLASGEWVEKGPVDWRFVAEVSIVELESDGRSRKTWIIQRNGAAYIHFVGFDLPAGSHLFPHCPRVPNPRFAHADAFPACRANERMPHARNASSTSPDAAS